MARRLKLTGFARFLIFLLIATPLIYSGVSIYKGDHPLDSLKKDFGIDLRSNNTEQVDEREYDQSDSREIDDLQERIDFLRNKNEELEMENERLKSRIIELEGR